VAGDILSEIVSRVRRRAEARATRNGADIRRAAELAPPVRDFKAALRQPGLSVIAEVKFASPSAGPIRPPGDFEAVVGGYIRAGAAALSILTEPEFFAGDLAYLERARRLADRPVPLLQKDFIVTEYQVYEARAAGADAILLIVAALSPADLKNLLGLARRLGLEALVEVHTGADLEVALDAGATVIGVNNRDLKTLAVDLDTCLRLRPLIPSGVVTVAESGLRSEDDVRRVAAAGYDAILVGEALMRAPDPGRALAQLTGGCLWAASW
jgi:indole-3-glycerol phosphate synthase